MVHIAPVHPTILTILCIFLCFFLYFEAKMISFFTKWFLKLKMEATLEVARESRAVVLDLRSHGLQECPSFMPELSPEYLKQVQCLLLHRNQLSELRRTVPHALINVKGLTLDYNQLSDLPFDMRHFKHLAVLNVSHNPFVGVHFFYVICQLKTLKVLWANATGLTEIPKEIKQLRKLRTLGLRRNKIKVLPRELFMLNDLRWLTLSSNRIKRIPQEIVHLQMLIHLNVQRNYLTVLPSDINHTQVQYLFLQHNRLTVNTDLIELLHTMPKLKCCWVFGNRPVPDPLNQTLSQTLQSMITGQGYQNPSTTENGSPLNASSESIQVLINSIQSDTHVTNQDGTSIRSNTISPNEQPQDTSNLELDAGISTELMTMYCREQQSRKNTDQVPPVSNRPSSQSQDVRNGEIPESQTAPGGCQLQKVELNSRLSRTQSWVTSLIEETPAHFQNSSQRLSGQKSHIELEDGNDNVNDIEGGKCSPKSNFQSTVISSVVSLSRDTVTRTAAEQFVDDTFSKLAENVWSTDQLQDNKALSSTTSVINPIGTTLSNLVIPASQTRFHLCKTFSSSNNVCNSQSQDTLPQASQDLIQDEDDIVILKAHVDNPTTTSSKSNVEMQSQLHSTTPSNAIVTAEDALPIESNINEEINLISALDFTSQLELESNYDPSDWENSLPSSAIDEQDFITRFADMDEDISQTIYFEEEDLLRLTAVIAAASPL